MAALTLKADPVRVEKAFPAIVTRKQFDRVSKLLRSRAPKIIHPRRAASPFLLSGLVKCRTCRRALTGQYSKSPRYPYYVCQSFMKRGSGACDAPRLNARRFEELVVERIRSNILTESRMPDLVKLVDEEMDGVTAEQRKGLSTIEAEIQEVKRQLGRLWRFIETSDDVDVDDLSTRIREHRDRQERLEEAATDARAVLDQRRSAMGDVNTIAIYAAKMTDFLDESELAEARALVKSFVKEIVITPGVARLSYTLPMPDGCPIAGNGPEQLGALATTDNSNAQTGLNSYFPIPMWRLSSWRARVPDIWLVLGPCLPHCQEPRLSIRMRPQSIK